ncbi:hypothetical protein [Cesiribacter andamanensis]|uniref:hypothetical protein n=1 Tax=Cesiribacter andamanensis TaxID=649507 RepID=UPI00034541AD|nr:hypothetical protein [Cesiribacter andamanensis]
MAIRQKKSIRPVRAYLQPHARANVALVIDAFTEKQAGNYIPENDSDETKKEACHITAAGPFEI